MFRITIQSSLNLLIHSKEGQQISRLKERQSSTQSIKVNITAATTTTMQVTEDELELGRNLVAASLHNISLKRAIIGAGILTLIMNLMRNTKSSRVLHCARTLANFSGHAKSKLILAKDTKLISLLTSILRCGCEDAERVQHYWYVFCML